MTLSEGAKKELLELLGLNGNSTEFRVAKRVFRRACHSEGLSPNMLMHMQSEPQVLLPTTSHTTIKTDSQT
eukprot:5161023-Amphidinium_carterae.1